MTTSRQSEAAKRGWETRRANGKGRHTLESRAKMAMSQMNANRDPEVRARRGAAISAAMKARYERLRAGRVRCPHCEGRGWVDGLSEPDKKLP